MEDKVLKIINHFGIGHQLKKLSEETYEFQEAVLIRDLHWNCDTEVQDIRPFDKHILEEMADIRVLLKQFQLKYNITDEELMKEMEYKINRTEERYLKEVKDIQNYESQIRSNEIKELAKKYEADLNKYVGMTD